MNQIDTLPRDRDFGKGFDYTTWSGKTSVAGLYRVPWSSDYRDIAYFPDQPALQTYLDTRPKLVGPNFSYLKYGQPVKFDIPFNEALKYNYLAVWNPEQPIESSAPDFSRWLYYFINDVIYESPNSTKLVLQLDAVQTFMREVRFGQVYAEQGHVGIAESTVQLSSQGILTQPEGLNLGADYVNKHRVEYDLARSEGVYRVMIVSNTNLEGDAGTVREPNLESATGSDFEGLPNGTNIYVLDNPEQLKTYLASMKDKAWVLQGIVSITALPYWIVNADTPWPRVTIGGVQAYKPNANSKLTEPVVNMVENFPSLIQSNVPERYRHLKKFSVYPYSFIEISTYSGEPLVLKPELWANKDGKMVIKYHLAPPSPRVGIRPYAYNTDNDTPIGNNDPDETDLGELWNVATWLSNFPQFSVVNNGYITTMASQAHSIQQSYRDAGWQQQKALSGNSLAYDQATAGMNLATDMTQNSVNSMQNQTALSNQTTASKAYLGGASALANGIGSGGPGVLGGIGSALTAGVGAAVDINQQSQSSAIQQRLANQQNQAQVGNQGYVRDTNKNYADFATKGDYQNAVNTINAKVEDAKLTQPSAAGTTGGDAFILATRGWRVVAKLKMVPSGALRTIGEYWLRYGYAINRFMDMPDDFRTMTIFTYWKVKESYIVSAQCPEPIKQALRGIFEKGVTVWHDPVRMGDPSALADNEPIMANYIDGE